MSRNALMDIPPSVRKLINADLPSLPPQAADDSNTNLYVGPIPQAAYDALNQYFYEQQHPVTVSDQVRSTRVMRDLNQMPERDHMALVISDGQAQEMLDCLFEGMSLPNAMRCAGVEPRAYNAVLRDAKKHRDNNPGSPLSRQHQKILSLQEDIRQQQGGVIRRVLAPIMEAAVERGNVQAGQWLLGKLDPKTYGNHTVVDHKGKVNHDGKVEVEVRHKVINARELSDEQFEALNRLYDLPAPDNKNKLHQTIYDAEKVED